MSIKPETGDRSAGNLATILGMVSVVKTRPISYEWSDQYEAKLALNVKPIITTLALVVGKEGKWKTSF
ncbi:hypothetical protein [Dehalococcoides sp.]|jgi:hypothetical protein|uniref:hypothetical protein n=1 Tax=Dehalococcoides sp. TaxID=1966486 RepID=UPI003564D62F